MTLVDDGAEILQQLDRWLSVTEDRAKYRTKHGRSLGGAHVEQIKLIRERLGALLETESDDLLARFQRVRAQAERLRTHG